MQGKVAGGLPAVTFARITPTGAGKRLTYRKTACAKQDHPRAGGEKSIILNMTSVRRGSPPRMRGKGAAAVLRSPAERITPACAGKRTVALPSLAGTWDHPRMRGEKCTRTAAAPRVRGSPPQARGKVEMTDLTKDNMRITPAGAGKRICLPGCTVEEKDHPRRRGEKSRSAV